jgi:hypothetical protein
MFNYTFLCYFSLKNEHFFWHKGKNIIVLNLWYICFSLYKGDLISDFEKFLDEVEKETKRNDLTFVDLVLDKNKSNNVLFKYTLIVCLSSIPEKFYYFKNKYVVALNLWFICFIIHKGDFIADIAKFQRKIKEITNRDDLTFIKVTKRQKKGDNRK